MVWASCGPGVGRAMSASPSASAPGLKDGPSFEVEIRRVCGFIEMATDFGHF